MQVATGIVVDGKVVVEGEVHLSPAEEAELLEANAEADRGETC
jgi:hypothetical protein